MTERNNGRPGPTRRSGALWGEATGPTVAAADGGAATRSGDLLPLKRRAWPEEPKPVAYSGLAGDVVSLIKPESEADPVALLIQLLVAFGNAAGRHAHLRVEADVHHCNLYAVLVGKSSTSRKGMAWRWVRALFTLCCPDWAERSVILGLSTGEGLIAAAQDIPDENGRRLLALETEYGSMLRIMTQREGNSLEGVLRQAWDDDRLQTNPRHKPLRVSGAHVSLLGHVTRDDLLAYFSWLSARNGFGPRHLFLAVKRSKELPLGGCLPEFADLKRRIGRALDKARAAGEMTRNPAATKLWCDEYHRLSAERPGMAGALAVRAPAQVLRLSMVYALLDESAVIGATHLRAALALWDYCERSVAYVFGEKTGNKVADTILAALREAGEAWLGQSEVVRLFNGHGNREEIAEALGLLEESGLAVKRSVKTDGRPRTEWSCAPPGAAKKAQ
jgi:hypothetical protein